MDSFLSSEYLSDVLGKYCKDGILTNVPTEVFIDTITRYCEQQKPKTRSNPKKKNKGPKRPTSAYLRWLSTMRKTIKDDYFSDINDYEETDWTPEFTKTYYLEKGLEDPKQGGKPKIVGLVTKKAGKIWKMMSDEEKEPYEKEFQIAQEEYYASKKDFKDDYEQIDDTQEFTDEYEGFDGPFKMKYIEKTIKNEDGKTIKMFKTFEEAVEKALMLGNTCYGITKTKRGYSVRDGCLKDTPDDNISKGLMSWTKTGFVEKKKSKRGRPTGSKNKKQKSNIIESSDDESYETETTPEYNYDIDSETEEIEMKEIEYDGEKYIVSNDGEVYDPDTADIVGKYVNKKIIFN